MRRWWLAVLALIAVGCLGLSFVNGTQRDRNLRAVGGVTAVADGDQLGPVVIRVERQGRVSWWTVSDHGDAGGSTVGSYSPQPEDCVGQLCYRLAGNALRVEVSEDGGATYTVAWEVDAGRYAKLVAAYPNLGDHRARWPGSNARNLWMGGRDTLPTKPSPSSGFE